MSLYVGVMSGTSLDGVDVATVRLEGDEERPAAADMEAFRSRPWDDAFRDRLERACRGGRVGEISDLDFELGRRFAAAVLEALEEAGIPPSDVAAVGSHGQTVWHRPPGDDGPEAAEDDGAPRPTGRAGGGGGRKADGGAGASTLQIGEAAVIAEETGLPVVSDFRVRDVAAGGQGAPLTPYFDRLLLAPEDGARGIQNLGGMGNLTALPPAGSGAGPAAFDTGPGTALLDGAARRLSGGARRMDSDGALAADGTVLTAALRPWLEDPFFAEPPPRSTGRERFGPGRLDAWLREHRGERPEDLLATLTELTARTVADALRWLDFPLEEMYLCGGGARNPELVRRLRRRLDPVAVRDLSELGWDPDAREAVAFALLARQHLLGVPASAPWATGARGPRILGKLTPA